MILKLVPRFMGSYRSLKPIVEASKGFYFHSSVKEISLVLVFDFANQNLDKKDRISPYFFAGPTVSFLNIHRDWSKMITAAFGQKTPVWIGLRLNDHLYHNSIKCPPAKL